MPPPTSMAEQMFADKNQILNKYKKAGVAATLTAFNSQKKNGDLYVDYTVNIPDIMAAARAEAFPTKIIIQRNAAGDWFCRFVRDKTQQKQGQSQKAQVEKLQESPQFKGLPDADQQEMLEAIMDFEIAFSITLPEAITETGLPFIKHDDKSAGYAFSFNLLKDPDAMSKIMNMAKNNSTPYIRCGTGPLPHQNPAAMLTCILITVKHLKVKSCHAPPIKSPLTLTAPRSPFIMMSLIASKT